jgi:RNA polymerase sigma factor (sigma-70 family)
VVSEVVVSVLSILERGVFRGESAFETYVHAIAKRKVIDVLREKYSRVSPKDLDGLLNIPPPPPFYTVYWREQRRLIVECLEQVNKMDRKVFELHYFHELTYKDIGKSLGFSSRWACIRGRRALRKVLQLFGERARECSRKSGVN